MFWGIARPVYRIRAEGLSFHGDGSGPMTGHQNSSAATRNRACSSRCAHGFSSARSNSGEKWLAHMTAANTIHDTDRERQPADDRRVEHGQDPAPAHLGRRGLEEQRDRAGEQQEGRARPASAAGAGPCASRTAWCRRRRAPSPRHTGPRPRRPPSRPCGAGRSGAAGVPGSPAEPPSPTAAARAWPAARPAGRTTSRTAGSPASGGTGTVGPWARAAAGRASTPASVATIADVMAATRKNPRPTALPVERAGGRATGLTGPILAPRAEAVRPAGRRIRPRSSPHAGQGCEGPRRSPRRV